MSKDRLQFEHKLWMEGYNRIMGLDEVGRGCLSGPVVAAGVILKPNTFIDGVRDSKALTHKERTTLAETIKERAEFWTIRWCTPREIDKLNILKASLKAMQRCADAPNANPEYLLVDGNRYGSTVYPYTCIVKGDDRSMSIGAASILAKVYRDELMFRLHEDYPCYGWDTNVGYPTKKHYEGLKEYGFTRHHRRSFKLRTTKKWSQ